MQLRSRHLMVEWGCNTDRRGRVYCAIATLRGSFESAPIEKTLTDVHTTGAPLFPVQSRGVSDELVSRRYGIRRPINSGSVGRGVASNASAAVTWNMIWGVMITGGVVLIETRRSTKKQAADAHKTWRDPASSRSSEPDVYSQGYPRDR